MNVSSGLANLKIKTPEILEFKGIKNGRMTKVYNKNAELKKSMKFSRTVSEVVTEKFTKKSDELQDNHNFRQDLASRRVKILFKNTDNTANIEKQLFQLIDECSNNQKQKGKTIININQLRKQIRKDIRIYLTNEIRKCTSIEGLKQLHERISSLAPSSKFDKLAKNKLDLKSINSLKQEMDKQCDRIVDALKFELDPKHNIISDNLNLKDPNTNPANSLVQSCDDIIDWIDFIREISPKTFENRRNRLCQLLSNTYQEGINSIKPHPTDLRETQTTLSLINKLSEKVKTTISSSIDDNRKLLNGIDKATSTCENSLKANLGELINATDNYYYLFKKMNKATKNLKKIQEDVVKTSSQITVKRIEQKQLEKTINSGNIFKRTFPQLFDRKNHNELNRIKKSISKSTKEQNALNSHSDQAKKILEQARSKTNSAYKTVHHLVEQYGESVTNLDGLSNVTIGEEGIPSVKDVLEALQPQEMKEMKNIKNVSAYASFVMEKVTRPLKNNQSIATHPEHMESISLFIDDQILKNPEITDTLEKFLAIYCHLLQPAPDGSEWSFDQTFQFFVDSCEILSEQQSSVEEAEQHLYHLLNGTYNTTGEF